MRIIIGAIVICLALSSPTRATYDEHTYGDFPDHPLGPIDTVMNTGCYRVAVGELAHNPGDLDYIRLVIPFISAETIIDVDIVGVDGAGDSLMRAGVNLSNPYGGPWLVNDNDFDDAVDKRCGLQGNPFDSVIKLGPTGLNASVDIGVSAPPDFDFTGAHYRKFAYEIWVHTTEVPEPSTALLVLLGTVFAGRRSRRRAA